MADEDEPTFLPATQTINPISEIPTTDHKALVIRLELPFYEYADMERLLANGLEFLRLRCEQFRIMKNDPSLIPSGLTAEDVEVLLENARRQHDKANGLTRKVKRPPAR